MDQRVPLWVIFYPQAFLDSPATPLEFAPFLSGKRLLTHQTFRDLFRSETIATSEEIGIRDITFLFTDLKGSTALYDRIGDAQAFYLVRQHFDTLQRIVCEHEGAIVKTIGDAIMACFMTPLQATQAALAMVAGMKDLNKGLSEELILKIGIHKGHSIAVTLNERVDYFGQTVNVAARVQGLAEANEICLSEEVYAFDGVTEAIEPHQVKAEQVEVKGVRGQLKIYRLAP